MEKLPDGGNLWRLAINSPGALSLNLLYDKFWLPDSSKFFLYNNKKTKTAGAFTSINNKGSRDKPGKFATELIYGDNVMLEYYQPAEVHDKPIISIAFVVHGYRYINISDELSVLNLGQSLPCNININCSQGAPYQIEKKGVALILVDGTRYCTGSLVNNTSLTLQPYFLTADHCLGGPENPSKLDAVTNPDAGYWSFMWNYESPTCSNPTTESSFYTTSGATVIANYQATDMALLHLTEDPINLENYTPAYVGWSRATTGASSSVGIHHPVGDIKKIWLSNQPAVPNATAIPWPDGVISPVNSHWQVQITSGAIQGGSSGSFMLNSDGLIVGQLHGGVAGCALNTGLYGRFDWSWDNGPNAQRRLRDWLDPVGTNPMQINTRERPNINGARIICTSQIYTLTSPPSGSTITWTLSNTGVFSLSPSGNTVTVTKIGEGTSMLRAQVGSVIIAERSITTLTAAEVSSTQYGACNAGGWQEWYLVGNSDNGTTGWHWFTDFLPPGVEVNIYNPNSTSTWASIRGGGAAIKFNFTDNCGKVVSGGTTIYSPCPSATLFKAIYQTEEKNIRISLIETQGEERFGPENFLLGKHIDKVTIYGVNGSVQREETFTKDGYNVIVDASDLIPGRYLIEIEAGTVTETLGIDVQ